MWKLVVVYQCISACVRMQSMHDHVCAKSSICIRIVHAHHIIHAVIGLFTMYAYIPFYELQGPARERTQVYARKL